MASQSSPMRGGRSRKFKSEINVVPYIDVMLVLLVIFMVVAPMSNPNVIDVPSAARSSLPPTEYIQISLQPDTNPTIAVVRQQGGSPKSETTGGRADLARRLAELHRQDPKLAVMVAADKNMKYDEVIYAVSEAKKLGFERVGLATR
ncbi:MAG: biopolymer transporter ExbD [Noviherbaspirillum sp.]